MAKLKKDLHKYVELREEDYLRLVEDSMAVELLKLAGVEIHVKPINRRYAE